MEKQQTLSMKNINQESNQTQLTPQDLTDEEHNFNFYHEYCRLYIANVVLTNQMKELVNEKQDLVCKLVKLEKKSEEISDPLDDDDRKKRFRRTASQIDRHFVCPDMSCQKTYGSEGSLNQHIKIKHPEIYKEKSICSNNIENNNSYTYSE